MERKFTYSLKYLLKGRNDYFQLIGNEEFGPTAAKVSSLLHVSRVKSHQFLDFKKRE